MKAVTEFANPEDQVNDTRRMTAKSMVRRGIVFFISCEPGNLQQAGLILITMFVEKARMMRLS